MTLDSSISSGLAALPNTLTSSQGNYDEADRLYLRCIDIEEKTLGPHHPELAASLHNVLFRDPLISDLYCNFSREV